MTTSQHETEEVVTVRPQETHPLPSPSSCPTWPTAAPSRVIAIADHSVDEGQQAFEVAMAFGHGRTLLNRSTTPAVKTTEPEKGRKGHRCGSWGSTASWQDRASTSGRRR